MAEKVRADELLLAQGFAQSREQAKRLIMAGQAYIKQGADWMRIDKPGRPLPREVAIFVKESERFVSRGGYKLLTAIEKFSIQVKDKVCLDVGASTGGFTDCLLQFGAARVYALDVGYGQLHWKLRGHEQVVNLEKVNIRMARPDLLPEQVDLLVIDCSFISLTRVLPGALPFLKLGGEAVVLVKPQFEVGPGRTVKGIVKSHDLAMETVERVISGSVRDFDLEYKGMVPSMIKGPKGNQEYLVWFRKNKPRKADG
ncbi:TlyA family RNA methyltransferase [Desulfonatronovibrio hydrogenovorans]|uniref:TlyA family RNA methyltransferase n=1 Tax=Desulfonatronovibrio hydrogenovorans TaxID=53245 RepID=UPI000491DE94|nr:TlyA family RNA methyltransferase [Desulfonatronovibrio hydrogenovorans]